MGHAVVEQASRARRKFEAEHSVADHSAQASKRSDACGEGELGRESLSEHAQLLAAKRIGCAGLAGRTIS